MPEIVYDLTLSVDGIVRRITGTQRVAAYDVVSVTLAAAADAATPTKRTVELLSAAGAAAVTFLLVASDPLKDVAWSVDGGATSHALDGPHLLVGAGAVSLLVQTPKKVTLTNASTAAAARVEILVGRDA